MASPGRNDPCSCGSGQKYKKCCLAKAEALRAAERPRRTSRETVMPKLLRFADSPQFDRDYEIADGFFWSDFLDDLDDDEADDLVRSEDAEAKFNAWFVWDLDIEDGVTIADMFLDQKGRSLEPAERAYVERMRRSCLSLYQVEDVDPGRGLRIRDLLSSDETFVHERLGTEQIVRWDILGARVVSDEDGVPMFEGGVYLYPSSDKAGLVKELARCRRRYIRRFPGEDRVSFLKRHGMVFNHLWLDHVVLRPPPSIRTAEGDELVFVTSAFDVEHMAALRDALESRDDIEADEDGALVWFEEAQGDFRRTLGTFRFEGDRLVLETKSRERDARGREWLQRVAPNLTADRRMEIETLADALATNRDRPPSTQAEQPPEFAAIERQIQDEYYRRWLDQPVPALQGETPRAASVSRKLRPVLLGLLREFENHYERQKLRGHNGFDPSWLWTELGLR